MREATMSWRRTFLCWVAVPLSAAVVTTSHAQSVQSAPAGAIAGTVTDTSGGVCPGVTVTLYGPVTSQSTTTNSSGRFRFDGLAAGTYRIEAKLHGFVTEPRDRVVVNDREVTLVIPMRFVPAKTPNSIE